MFIKLWIKFIKLREKIKDMAKCAICNEKIENTFLCKIRGTFIKKKAVCSACQKVHGKEVVKKI